MPTSTSRFRFEFRLLSWAEGLSRAMAGERCGLFVGFRPDGSTRRIYFAPPGLSFDGDRKAALTQTYERWFLYSPYDDEGTGYLEWLGVDRAMAERWLGRRFEPVDFIDVRSTSARDAFPEAWRVILA